jgi:hypothetical protein
MDVFSLCTFPGRMRCNDSVRGVGARDIEIAILEAPFAAVDHFERLQLVSSYGAFNLSVLMAPAWLWFDEL